VVEDFNFITQELDIYTSVNTNTRGIDWFKGVLWIYTVRVLNSQFSITPCKNKKSFLLPFLIQLLNYLNRADEVGATLFHT